MTLRIMKTMYRTRIEYINSINESLKGDFLIDRTYVAYGYFRDQFGDDHKLALLSFVDQSIHHNTENEAKKTILDWKEYMKEQAQEGGQ